MASSYDPARRRSLGATTGPPPYVTGPLEPPPPPPPPSFPARSMPPPSPPQNPPPSHHIGTTPRGPPVTSTFSGVRDLSSHRAGMSISSILGGSEEHRPHGSPHSATAASSTPKSMQPPSPARARSSSMRESGDRYMMKGPSPSQLGPLSEAPRTAPESRRDGMFGSPQFRREPGHGFRAYRGPVQEHARHMGGNVTNGAPVRPNSQPAESATIRNVEDFNRHEALLDGRPPLFRPFGDAPLLQRSEMLVQMERPSLQSGITSIPPDRSMYSNPPTDHDRRAPASSRFPRAPNFGPLGREEQLSAFRPTIPPTSQPTTESSTDIMDNRSHDMRRQLSQPLLRNENGPPERIRHEHGRLHDGQRVDTMHREHPQKENEGSVHRAVLNLSPELSRKGRNSPLPQAVQGAQPRHIGPGGDNPGIKMEFGRMFSGLGSGVGSSPHPLHGMNGSHTPSRMSPARHLEGGDLIRVAVAELDDKRAGSKAGSRIGRRNGRRPRDDGERFEIEGRNTPDLQSSNKRAKTAHPAHHHHHSHPHHHHHHHHHEIPETGPISQNMMRYPSNPLSQANTTTNQAHHHHHHHAHPTHHHHHNARTAPPPQKPTVTVVSKKVLEGVANNPRKHLGSQLYSTEVFLPTPAEVQTDSRSKFSSKMKPIPVWEGKENCTYTVRVPRYYLGRAGNGATEYESFGEICKRRQLWGTEVYTDDSDVVAAAVHSGWLEGDFGFYNNDLHEVRDQESEQVGDTQTSTRLEARPRKPVKVPDGHDVHITVLILPPLESYASTNQHHVWSREWDKLHDGMSFMIHRIDFVDEGGANRYVERGAAARKSRIAAEEAARREAAAGLLMIANGSRNGIVSVGA